MTVVYLGLFAVGGIGVLAALLLTDFDVGHADVGHSLQGMPFLSLTSLSAGLLGAGTGGLVSGWSGLGGLGAGVIAAVSGLALILALQGLLLPYLRRQEANSHRGRSSYIGLLGTVTLEVPAGGWGEVAFVDAEGNRVRSRAVSAETAPLSKSTRVYIADVDADYVHVVAVPEP
ncbi:hypothetical protein [Mycolicibacterium palauense]|uniref:hypothetical protein n=1 Tax=Mycolicibacterium palauense TaxID=2034511 RepID=UPI000BFF1835